MLVGILTGQARFAKLRFATALMPELTSSESPLVGRTTAFSIAYWLFGKDSQIANAQ